MKAAPTAPNTPTPSIRVSAGADCADGDVEERRLIPVFLWRHVGHQRQHSRAGSRDCARWGGPDLRVPARPASGYQTSDFSSSTDASASTCSTAALTRWWGRVLCTAQ